MKWAEMLPLLLLILEISALPKALSHKECNTLLGLKLQGQLSFLNSSHAANDFGSTVHHEPAGVFYPSSVEDISTLIAAVAKSPQLTIAARGHGHSIQGQAQAPNGIVVDMSSLKGIQVFPEAAYADVSAGELWIDVLKASLEFGLTPTSWTDYLYLTVGGTLSNAGVSGQAFRYGPQISNVLQMEVVTGKGQILTCSPTTNADLFFAALGGLGQFGIITKARIILEPAHEKVRYIRALYSDFKRYTADLEKLMSQPKGISFDYIEGYVVLNNDDPGQGINSVPFSGEIVGIDQIPQSAGPLLYCIEVAKYYSDHDLVNIDQQVNRLLDPLGYIPSLIYSTDMSYFDFLNRVRATENTLRNLGAWDVPHPWLILFVPKSQVSKFNELILEKVLQNGVNGPMLVYPFDASKWDSRTSAVVPDEEVFYMVGLLRYVVPGGADLETHLQENAEVLRICEMVGIKAKQYLPHYTTTSEWQKHFGPDLWLRFVNNKLKFDPSAIFSPGQMIFTRNEFLNSMS